MSFTKKTTVTWRLQPTSERQLESPSDNYDYSNTFEPDSNEYEYSDTFIGCDSYSDTFMSASSNSFEKSRSSVKANSSAFNSKSKQQGSAVFKKVKKEHSVSFEDTDISIQEATLLETAKNVTDALETVLEVDSQTDNFEDSTFGGEDISDTHPPDTYTDTFDSEDKTRADSQYDATQASETQGSSGTHPSKSYEYSSAASTYSEEDSLLDHSFIAPDRNCKS